MEKKTIRSKTAPTVTGTDLEDSRDLQRAIDFANRRLQGHRRVSDADVAAFAAPLGGAKHPQQWMDYRNGKRRIPARDKLIAALFLQKSPEMVFSTWEKPILPMLLQVIAFGAQMAVSHGGLESLGKLLQEIAGAHVEQRDVILLKIKDLLG
jgi:hypothetical protein